MARRIEASNLPISESKRFHNVISLFESFDSEFIDVSRDNIIIILASAGTYIVSRTRPLAFRGRSRDFAS